MQLLVTEVGGLIGVGKTTAITTAAELLRQRWSAATQVVAVFEPVDEWVASGRLAEYYSAPAEQALTFQRYVLETRVDAIVAATAALDPDRPAVLLLDRGLDDDQCFALANHALGNMTDAELEAYEAALAAARDELPARTATLRLWLDAPVAVCAERCAGRARSAETAVSTEYLRCLEQHRPEVDGVIDARAPAAAVAEALATHVAKKMETVSQDNHGATAVRQE